MSHLLASLTIHVNRLMQKEKLVTKSLAAHYCHIIEQMW
jgi:hypothetical protein